MSQKQKLIICAFVFTLLLSAALYLKFNPSIEKQAINLDKAEERLKKEERLNDIKLKAIQWVSSGEESLNERELVEVPSLEGERQLTNKETVEMLFAAINLEKTETFLSLFVPQVISESIYNTGNENNIEVLKSFIEAIKREGFKKIEIGVQNKSLSHAELIEATIYFENNTKSTVIIELERSEASHHEADHDHEGGQYLVKTAPEEIIEQIEKNLTEYKDKPN